VKAGRDSRTAGILRSAAALAVVLVFWGALGYTFWPELLPGLLRAVQSLRGIGAREVESTYFEVRNGSSAGEEEVRAAVRELDGDYAAIERFLGRRPAYRIPALITNGSGPALTDGLRLNLFYDGGTIDLSTAPFFLVLLSEGEIYVPDVDVFVEAGFAVWVVEGIGRAQPLIGQSSDAWVASWREAGTLVPLTEAQEVGVPGDGQDLARFVRAVLQGGSFMRWLANAYGAEAVYELRSGLGLEDITGLSLAEAEQAWLAAVAAEPLDPRPCAQAVPEGSVLRTLCQQLDGDHENG
jgi:hypothetical protein